MYVFAVIAKFAHAMFKVVVAIHDAVGTARRASWAVLAAFHKTRSCLRCTIGNRVYGDHMTRLWLRCTIGNRVCGDHMTASWLRCIIRNRVCGEPSGCGIEGRPCPMVTGRAPYRVDVGWFVGAAWTAKVYFAASAVRRWRISATRTRHGTIIH